MVKAPEAMRGDADDQRRAHRRDQLGIPAALSAAAEDLVRADRELAEHVRKIRLDNAEAILEAKNERTASLYLDSLPDTEEHRRLQDNRAKADLDHQHARREVERLHLIVRVLGTQVSEGIRG
jgi:thioredoxin-like negative regulator of GroEL